MSGEQAPVPVPVQEAPVLEGSDLTKTFRRGPEEVHALSGADLIVRAGEIVALVGPSGSGKTTLLSVLAGWERPDRGEICWLGRPLPDPASLGWGDMAIVPQTLGMVEELSIRENVELPFRLGGGAPSERSAPERSALGSSRVNGLLDDLGLAGLASRLPAEVSLGEQQRGALARALVLGPRLLMADEPTGHQDVDWTRGVLRVLEAASSDGIACLIATHHRALVHYADRALRISDGRIDEVQAGDVVAAGDEL
jgi:ABC-type lipoprotein export system ATPase subunit